MTVRQHVKAIQVELRDGAVTPDRASELLLMLTSLVGNVNDEIRAADAAYADVLVAALRSHEKANRARIEAETSPEFQRKREARDTRELVKELIGSLKYFLRAQVEEMRLTR